MKAASVAVLHELTLPQLEAIAEALDADPIALGEILLGAAKEAQL